MKSVIAGMLLLTACYYVATTDSGAQINSNAANVYKIDILDPSSSAISYGSGVAYRIEEEGSCFRLYLITARHVIENVNDINKAYLTYNHVDRFRDYSKEDELTRILLRIEPLTTSYDLSIVSCLIKNQVSVVDIMTEAPASLSEVYTLGFPYGLGLHYTEGRVSFLSQEGSWHTNSQITHGNSGGGVFDKKTNKLIGISVALPQITIANPYTGLPSVHYVWHMQMFLPLSLIREKLR